MLAMYDHIFDMLLLLCPQAMLADLLEKNKLQQ